MPNKKNKKPSKNGYWQFVLECRDKNPNKSMTMQEAQAYATKKWANMTKEERRPYEEMAMLARDTYHPVKLTSDGQEIEEVERQQKEAEQKVQRMKDDITNGFRTASLAGKLDEEIFILVHVNHLTYYPAEERYFICEIALAAVSLKDGIREIFHRTVKPGKLPLGFYGPALAHSKETHQMLQVVHDEPYENNTEEVFFDMIAFMKRYKTNKLPVLYAEEKTLEMITNVMDNFCAYFEFSDEIKVYNMQYMFYALKNAAAGRTVWRNETYSYNEIEKDLYLYVPNIGCDFHEMAELPTYCSKSIVTRYAYTICDICCAELAIELIPGKHVPLKAKITDDSSKFGSKSSSMVSLDHLDQASNRGRLSSISSQDYDDNYPPLGGSSASSVISFSSMKSTRSRNSALTKSNVAALEQSFQTVGFKEMKRDHKRLKFPQHSYPSQ